MGVMRIDNEDILLHRKESKSEMKSLIQSFLEEYDSGIEAPNMSKTITRTRGETPDRALNILPLSIGHNIKTRTDNSGEASDKAFIPCRHL